MIFLHGCRSAIAWTMIALYGLIASGLPLPLGGALVDGRVAAKDRSRPFPCMNKPCGCRSARQCFTSCCCHTPAETLAWARSHGLEPAVLAALASRVAAATPQPVARGCCSDPADCHEDGGPDTGCDATSPDDTVCSDYQSLAADPVEGDPGIPPARPEQPADDTPTPTPTDAVILRAMLACGGIVSQWTAVATSLPPPATISSDLSCPAVGVVTLTDVSILTGGGPPDTPPPKA